MTFQNAKVIGEGVEQKLYRTQTHPVGHPQHIMSRGALMEFSHCPSRWRKGYESDDTKATEWGSLMDCLVLTPNRFADDYAIAPATYESVGMECPTCKSITKAKSCKECGTARVRVVTQKPWDWNSTVCDDWRKARPAKVIIKSEDNQRARAALDVIHGEPELRFDLMYPKTQVMVVAHWKDKNTGLLIPVKCLIDFIPTMGIFQKALGDLKTGATAEPRRHARAVYDRWYDAQAAIYLDVYCAATGEDRTDFLHIVQESYAPYETASYLLSSEFIACGRAKYQSALAHYAHCLKTNQWPGYGSDSEVKYQGTPFLKPEPWMEQAAMEKVFTPPKVEPQEEPQEVNFDLTP